VLVRLIQVIIQLIYNKLYYNSTSSSSFNFRHQDVVFGEYHSTRCFPAAPVFLPSLLIRFTNQIMRWFAPCLNSSIDAKHSLLLAKLVVDGLCFLLLFRFDCKRKHEANYLAFYKSVCSTLYVLGNELDFQIISHLSLCLKLCALWMKQPSWFSYFGMIGCTL